ncbi:hypothetical protein ASG67_02050 [Sphingomonas sp. Leaf339]|uniref:hypothetical protein n=1 Tax=Sphingomonas sp. Leaf339 TaxID=1736343 RepID=UPI0006FAD86E|nr:hypothetical protein [Sphingomonas sp. Leaf339]KQU61958.1 hypothetical protein ASG67_02050 [Sphingomonas sp. Leaf339]
MWFAWFAMLAASAAAAPAVQSAAGRTTSCSTSDVVRISPADQLQLLDDFRTGLPARDRQRLDLVLPRYVDGGIAQCDDIDRSRASCESGAYLPALRKTGLMARFLAASCSKNFKAETKQGYRSHQ